VDLFHENDYHLHSRFISWHCITRVGVREIKSKSNQTLALCILTSKTFDEGDEMIAWKEMNDLKKRVQSRKTDEAK
jgi:hypothetical protein